MNIKDRLELCRRATPGPWHVYRDNEGDVAGIFGPEKTACDENDEAYNTVCEMPVEKYGYGSAWASADNAAFIAAHDPAYVAKLLKVAEAAKDIFQSIGNPDGWPTLAEALEALQSEAE